jgi:uncharacterized protein YggE
MRLIFLCLLLLSTTTVCAQDRRTVKVVAEKELEIAPDTVEVHLVVRTENEKLIDAKRANDKIINDLISLADTQEIPATNFQVMAFDMQSEFTSAELRKMIPSRFDCNRTIVVKLTDFDRLETFLSDAFTAGINYVKDIRYTVSDERPHLQEARKLAVADAQEKAQALCDLTNMKLGTPVHIEETTYTKWNYWGYGGMAGASGMSNETGSNTSPQDKSPLGTRSKYVFYKEDIKKEAHLLFTPAKVNLSLQVTIEFEILNK